MPETKTSVPILVVIGPEVEGCVEIVDYRCFVRRCPRQMILVGHSREYVPRLPVPNV